MIATFLLSLLSFLASGLMPIVTRQQTVDSLFTLLPDAKGTDQVDILNHLALELAPRSFDSSFQYATDALRLSEELNYPMGKGIATFNIGNSYYFKSDIKNALTNYLTALRILEPFEPAGEIGDLLLMLGSINEYVRNTEKVLKYYHRAAENYYAVGDSSSAMLVYIVLGSSYYYKVQALSQIDTLSSAEVNMMMDSAVKFSDVALDYYLVPHREYKWMSAEAWLANIYNYYGSYYVTLDDSLSQYYYYKALEKSREILDTDERDFIEGMTYGNLSYQYYFWAKNTDTAIAFAKNSEKLMKKPDRYDIYVMTLSILGDIYLDLGHYHVAEDYYLKALYASDTFLLNIDRINQPDPTFRLWAVTQNRSMRLMILAAMVQLYEQTGDFKNALAYQKRLEEEKNIQSRDELTRQIMGLEANYEDELQRQEIASLARDNELHRVKLNRNRILFGGISGALFVILLLVIVWIQRQRFHSEHKALVLEQKLLRLQMNPHFIFNSLYSIQNFIVTEKPDKASIYLSKFAKLVRNILDNSTEEYVSLEKEISTIENYMELQKVRYAGKFDYKIEITDEIDVEILEIPPMLAQPFIENAIEHGIIYRETPGHIDIRFSLKNQTLIFEVEDDGVGRQTARKIETALNPEHHSMATSLIRERLANLNRKLHRKIFLEIIDLKNTLDEPSGTRVVFGIPVSR